MSRKTRREFNRTAAALGVATVVGSESRAQPRAESDPDIQTKALAAFVEDRYGKFLTAEQLARVRQRLQAQLGNGRQLNRVPVQNGDEPDFIFTPDVP